MKFIKLFKLKKDEFLLKESKILENIPRLNILSQIYAQTPFLYELNSTTKFLSPEWNKTKELIKKGSWK